MAAGKDMGDTRAGEEKGKDTEEKETKQAKAKAAAKAKEVYLNLT